MTRTLDFDKKSATLALGAAICLGMLGCSSAGDGGGAGPELDRDAPLSDLDALFRDAPTNAKLDELGKADALYPKQFNELLALQSPVQSQQSRGVCSIFATNALMEHLYIKEGTIADPDFSEQYLQWSVKVEVGDFTYTEGSNARSNLAAIERFGIPVESAWPYQGRSWSTSDDPACNGGENLPVRCYTNGDPPESAKTAEKFFLPVGRWVNANDRSIKAHMTTKKQAATVGLTFYYQSWNHRASALPTSNELWRQGIVPYPNAKDKEESKKKRAGHAILLVGWDDELEVQPIDAEGNPMVDAAGNPVKEKGFFIFKNSWGTGSFGVDNPHGPGYGFISMRYVKEEGTVYVSDLPKLETGPEICNDGKDNDRNGKIDCDDEACSADLACTAAATTYENTTPVAIPDNNKTGITSQIVVPTGGTLAGLQVTVDITHTYRGDLKVKLVGPGGAEVILHDRDGGSADHLKQTFAVAAFDGQDAAGTWTLVVADEAAADKGTLNSWKLAITTCSGASCSGGNVTSYSSTESKSIPDNSAQGISTDIAIDQAGTIQSLNVTVDITHPAKGDLNVRLQRIGLGEVVLFEADASSGEFGTRSFAVPSFVGDDAAGVWRLIVADVASGDVGTLNGWSIELKR
jgi:subtilisin-like proprotein convertase family protein